MNNNSPRHQNKKKRHRKRQRIVQGEMSQFVDFASKKSLDDILKDNPEWYEESGFFFPHFFFVCLVFVVRYV